MFLGTVSILHGVEGAEHRSKIPVANQLGIANRILVEAALPRTTARGGLGDRENPSWSEAKPRVSWGNAAGFSPSAQAHMLLIPIRPLGVMSQTARGQGPDLAVPRAIGIGAAPKHLSAHSSACRRHKLP